MKILLVYHVFVKLADSVRAFSFDSSLQKELRELGKLDLSLSQIKQANIFVDDKVFSK